MRDWDYDVSDYLRLIKAYLENRTDVTSYREQLCGMNTKRSLLDDDSALILQKVYSATDDYDPDVRLPYTTDEPELRRILKHYLNELEALGHTSKE